MKTIQALGFATLMAALVAGAASATPPATGKAASRALFKKHCALCHGQDGKGNTRIGREYSIPDLLSPAIQEQNDAELTQIIDGGKQLMPAFKTKLKPQQVKDLVTYIRELAKTGTAPQK